MDECDILIVGAGPAGAVAATVLARAGARVRLLDRATFPRDKLCGDTINPGTLAMLRRLKMADAIELKGLRVDGMIVTGEAGVSVKASYPDGLHGCALSRSELDSALVERAVDAGAIFEPGVNVGGALLGESRGRRTVDGVVTNGAARHSRVTIAADGRRSALAFGLGLLGHPIRPRRWAIGGYFEQVGGMSPFGEMHVRRGRYIGVAPVAGGRTNVCLVKPSSGGDGSLRHPAEALEQELAGDEVLRDRFRHARLLAPPTVLGPLAVDVVAVPPDGLILAGDAAGFVDPMTGDGLRFAVRGGELAAEAALEALAHGWEGLHAKIERRRQREFASKWRFNRLLRALVGSPLAVRAAGAGARYAPALLRAAIRRAGDCDLA